MASNGRANTVINGLRPSYSNITLDGINFQDSVRVNGLDYLPTKLTIAQVAEFTVSTTNANPTIGGGASTIAMSTPSGGNQFHGGGYWYTRNSYFGANDWFNNMNGVRRPFTDLNQIGGVLGGPIKKDKLFFFTNYEAFRQKQQTPITNTILTPTARQGILQYKDAGGNILQYDVLKNSGGLSINPAIQALLQNVPTTGNTNSVGDGLNTTGYAFNARNNETRDNILIKGDYVYSTKHVFAGSYVWNRDLVDRPDYTPFYGLVPPIYNDNSDRLISASWRWTPTNTLTNEFRGGINRAPGTFANRQAQPAYFITNTLFSSPLESSEVSEGRHTNLFNLQDNANWTHGRHTVSFGYQMNVTTVGMFGYNGTIPSEAIGISPGSTYGFATGQIPGASSSYTTTANSLLQTLGGLITSQTQTFNPTSRTSGFVSGAPYNFNERFGKYALYGMDQFKVRNNLTLTLGLRWDYMAPVDEVNGMYVSPVLANNNAVTTLLSNANLDFAGGSTGRSFYKKDLNNFAPNISLAWDPTGSGKTAIRAGFNIAYVDDNAINDLFNVVFNNPGITTTLTQNNLLTFANQAPSLKAPAFQIPTTAQAQFNLSPSSPPAMYMVDPNLANPYVVQWNLSIQHTVKGFLVEGRYVGDHGTKLFRTIDLNQINVKNGGFLQDFLRAQANGNASLAAGQGFNPAYNAAIPGSQQLTFFPLLPSGGNLSNSTIRTYIQQGQVGTLGQTYQSNQWFPNAGFSYFPNPLSLVDGLETNLSNSTYNSLQLEVSKRMAGGMQFQANYTFSKALTDAFGQRGLDMQLDNNNPGIEKARANFDQTHAIKLNHYIPLPFGPNKRFLAGSNGILKRLVGGWGVSGFLSLYSGNPLSLYTGGRGTLNRGARSTYNTANTFLTLSQLQDLVGVRKTGNGVYYFAQSAINPNNNTGTNADGSPWYNGQAFFNPGAGTLGTLQRRILNAPWYDNYNFSLSKMTQITERHSIELHANFFNIFNHPNFYISDQNINSTSFGKITSQFYSMDGIGPRAIQFGLVYKF